TARSFVVRQLGVIAPETRYEGLRTDDGTPAPMPNGYQHVLAYSNGDLACTFEDCKSEQVAIEDVAARILRRHPWKEEQPVKRLYDFPRQVQQIFTVDLGQELLRLEPDKNRNLLGVKHLPGMRVHNPWPLQPLSAENRLAANVKVWQPDFPEAK